MRRTWIAGSVVAACVAILLADSIVASRRAPQDDKLILNLQRQVKSDASLAPKLAAEQKRVTAARLARKSRDNVVAWTLIAAAALFLTWAGQAVPRRAVAAPLRSRLTNIRVTPNRLPTCDGPIPSRDGKGAVPAAPELDLTFVDQLVAQHGRSRESAIPLLQAIQSHYRYLPDEALRRLCELTEITPAQIAGTSSFYAKFRRSPTGKHIVRVCHGTACHVAGARQVSDELRRYLAIPEGADTDAERMFTVDEVACLGCCSLAPVLMVDGQTAGRLTPSSACDALQPFEERETA